MLLVCLLFACSSVRRVRPLESGASAITVSLGGPITEVAKKYIPLPLLSAGYNYGINNRPAMLAYEYGRGRVFLTGVHTEFEARVLVVIGDFPP